MATVNSVCILNINDRTAIAGELNSFSSPLQEFVSACGISSVAWSYTSSSRPLQADEDASVTTRRTAEKIKVVHVSNTIVDASDELSFKGALHAYRDFHPFET